MKIVTGAIFFAFPESTPNCLGISDLNDPNAFGESVSSLGSSELMNWPKATMNS